MRPEIEAWHEEALWDLENAPLMYDNQRWSSCVFHVHQAAEKACKAFLFSLGKTPWGHIVSVFFADYLQATKKNRDELIECAKDLDRHYIPSRYPFGSMDIAPHKLYTKKIAAEARCCAKQIVELAKQELQ